MHSVLCVVNTAPGHRVPGTRQGAHGCAVRSALAGSWSECTWVRPGNARPPSRATPQNPYTSASTQTTTRIYLLTQHSIPGTLDTMTSPLAKEQERLRQMAAQALRTARTARSDILYSPYATAQDRVQANETWYAVIRQAAEDRILTPAQIQQAAIVSRQRYYQIVSGPRKPAGPKPTDVHLPETDV